MYKIELLQLLAAKDAPFERASLSVNSEFNTLRLFESCQYIAPPLPAPFESHITFLIIMDSPLTSLTLIAPPLVSA